MDPLAGKYTRLQRLVHQFHARRDIPFRKKFFIGYDLHGNTYWEFTVDGNMQRLRRKMEPYEPQLFEADYFKTVPPQWLMWLRRTRNNPPSLQELADDQVRQQRIKLLAQMADEKWQNEKLRLEKEQNMKLQSELDRAAQLSENWVKSHLSAAAKDETIPDTAKDEPILAVDTANTAPVSEEEPSQTPPPSADPWAHADATKDSNPILSVSINPNPRQ